MKSHSVQPVWKPEPTQTEASRMNDFRKWVERRHELHLVDYSALHQWSVDNLGSFWAAVWEYFRLPNPPSENQMLAIDALPGAVWYPAAALNYVDHVLRFELGTQVAIHMRGEDQEGDRDITVDELRHQVANLANTLRELGVTRGDRVVGYLPNIAETVISFLATASIGAVWAVCGQDYSVEGVLSRLGQLEPVVLITCDGYQYAGKAHHRRSEISAIRAELPSLRATIGVSRLGTGFDATADIVSWETATIGSAELVTEPVSFDHPLWVLFSSGTTGKPKGIVHGHGGVLLEHLKLLGLHHDLSAGDTFFWYTSPSWMMWNVQVAGLLVGAGIVCYDGSPSHPQPDQLWRLADQLAVNVLGTSPAYLAAAERDGQRPSRDHDLSSLRLLGVTGSVLPPSAYHWAHDNVGAQVAVAAISGGTDVVSAFLAHAPSQPVWPGELSVVCLGVALQAWDDAGQPLTGLPGELVVTRPMPSMPVCFWGDKGGSRYRETYFETYPEIWRHGDLITVTDRGSVVIHGRSDATLNRNGIRMGSADVYHALQSVGEVVDALIVGLESPDGSYRMPLFVQLTAEAVLDETLKDSIRTAIRNAASPRHVPDDIIAVPGIPRTKTGKKLEVPVKRILQGADPESVVDLRTVDRPELLVQWPR